MPCMLTMLHVPTECGIILCIGENLKWETKPAFNVVVQLIYYSIDVNGKFITFRKIKWLPICLCSHDITEILLKVALSTINHINQTKMSVKN